MALLDYIATGERLNKTNLNKAIRQLLTDSGLDPDADFPGFAQAYATLAETATVLSVLVEILSIGAIPGTTGTIRLPSAFSIVGRNNANTANVTALASDASDRLLIGSSNVTRLDFYIDAAMQMLMDDGIFRAVVDNDIELGSATIRFKDIHTLLLKMYDGILTRAKLQDYSEVIYAQGNKTGAFNVDYELGNNHSVTLTGNATITVTNWPGTGNVGRMTLWIVGNGTATLGITNIDWGTQGAPATIASGATLIVNLITKDGGTNVAGSWASGFTL